LAILRSFPWHFYAYRCCCSRSNGSTHFAVQTSCSRFTGDHPILESPVSSSRRFVLVIVSLPAPPPAAFRAAVLPSCCTDRQPNRLSQTIILSPFFFHVGTSWSELSMGSFLWYARLLPHVDYLLYACPAASNTKLITSQVGTVLPVLVPRPPLPPRSRVSFFYAISVCMGQHLKEKMAIIRTHMRLLVSLPYSDGNSVAEVYGRKEGSPSHIP
jgi:hypothetical protein